MRVADTTPPPRVLGKFVNFDDEQRTGQIVAVGGDIVYILMNWQECALWDDVKMSGDKPWDKYEWPLFKPVTMMRNEVRDLVSETPKYLLQDVALVAKSSIIQPIQRRTVPLTNPPLKVAKPFGASSTPLRTRSGLSQEIEIMAKCAVFDSENLLVAVYDSKKEAKAHNKGTDLQFIDAKNFPEDGIGEYATVEDLFPPKEKPEATEGEKRTRTVTKLVGNYTVVKTDSTRLPEGDARADIANALFNNDNFESFFEQAPTKVTYTNNKGVEAETTASAYAGYAVRRGWISVGEVVVEEE